MSTFLSDLQSSLHSMFHDDSRVTLLGEDVLDPYGGAFKVAHGLSTAFPDRVLTTPISEAGIVGVATGMALRGLRPIVEIMFGDFVTLVADQIINHAAKFETMYNRTVTVPLVVRTPMGGGRGYGPTHSQTLDKLFLGVPHLRLVAPSVYHRPGSLLRTATLADDGVVLFVEHKLLYPAHLVLDHAPPVFVETREDDGGYPTAVVRNYSQGAPDVCVITYGGSTLRLHRLLGELASEEIRVTLCVPSCIQPLPLTHLAAEAAEARRVVVVEEGTGAHGWGAEVAATLNTSLWGQLDAPIRRVAAKNTVVPAAKTLEDEVLPSDRTIEDAIIGVLA